MHYFTTTTPSGGDDTYSLLQTCLDRHIQSMCEWVGGGAPDGLGVVKYPPTQPVAQKSLLKGKPTHSTTHSLHNTLQTITIFSTTPSSATQVYFSRNILSFQSRIFSTTLTWFFILNPYTQINILFYLFKKCQKHSQSHTQIKSTKGSSYWML